MLIIGRSSSVKTVQGNVLEALNSCIQTGVDMLELTVSVTKDNIPVVVYMAKDPKHQPSTSTISRSKFNDLYKQYTDCPVVPLSQVLDEFFGSILLMIKPKGTGAGQVAVKLLEERYIKRKDDWDNVIISSSRWKELASVRDENSAANLALLQSENPFQFIALYRRLNLAAVGFHRLHLNKFALEIARRTGLFTFVSTVNRPGTAVKLAQKGVDGIVTERPEGIMKELAKRSSNDL